MKDLIQAIQTALRDSADLLYIGDANVFITEDECLFPAGIEFPAVGIKDGPVQRIEMIASMMEYCMTVKIVALVQLAKPGTAIMGDTSTGKKGILDMEKDIHKALDENLLSIEGMISAVAASNQGESEVFGDEVEMIQRKVITYEYVKETERPSIG